MVKMNKITEAKRKSLKKLKKAKFPALHLDVQEIVLIAIIAVVIAVVAFLIMSLAFSEENVTKRKVEELARDYYENYYFEKNKNEVPKHAEKGLGNISLRQLVLFDNGRHLDMSEELSEVCDTSATSVNIYPEAPYEKQNYRVEYNYSCNF